MGDSASEQRPARRGRPRSTGSSVLTPPTGLPPVPDQRTPPARSRREEPVPAPPPRPTVVRPCVCGHGEDAHDHYRPGTDCGACGAAECSVYRFEGGPVRRLLRRLGVVG